MATPASALQLAANRANALLSTGPRTDQGRATSSANARTHGLTSRQALLPGEDPAEYQSHHQAYADRFHPQNPVTQELVTELADLRWRLSRVPAFETELLNAEFIRLTTEPELQPLIKNLESGAQILAVAFTRLVERKVLPNLFHQEARLARRAEKLQAQLETRRVQSVLRPPAPPPIPEKVPGKVAEEPPPPENQKNEANSPQPPQQPVRVTPQPGRNEPCPCNSGRKFKHCCLNNKATASPAS